MQTTTTAAKKTMATRLRNVKAELIEAEGWALAGKPGAKATVTALTKDVAALTARYDGMVAQ